MASSARIIQSSSAWFQKKINLRPQHRGVHLVTEEILRQVPELSQFAMGLCHVQSELGSMQLFYTAKIWQVLAFNFEWMWQDGGQGNRLSIVGRSNIPHTQKIKYKLKLFRLSFTKLHLEEVFHSFDAFRIQWTHDLQFQGYSFLSFCGRCELKFFKGRVKNLY